jgi:iron(III) transport system permease protein
VMGLITLGLAAPAVLAGTFLAFAAALADFGVAAVVGLPANFTVLSTKIFQLVRSFDLADNFAQAAALSTILLLFGLLALWLEYLWLGGRRFATLSFSARREPYLRLGAWRGPAVAVAALFIVTSLGLPLVAVALTSLTKVYGLPPTPTNWTLDNFRQVLFEAPETARALRNSLLLAAGSATAIMALGFLTARTAGRPADARLRIVLEFLVAVPYAVPGIVVALAMILAWLRPIPLTGFSLYNTVWIILVAYLARFLIFGVRTASAAMAQVHEGLLEAAQMSGASWARAQLRVALPLVRKSLLAGWLLIFVPALTELTVSVLLWSAGNETVGVAVYNLQDHGNLVQSASLALVVMVLVLLGNWLAQRLAGETSVV